MLQKYTLPDFLIIGAGKCGTTSLNHYLQQHPKIFMSKVKEPNFFAYESYPKDNLNGSMLKHYKESVIRLADYQKLFEEAGNDQVVGEVSNTYMVVEQAAERIKYYIPNAKLIAILRQPAERLYSRYLHLARENRLPTKDFRACMDKSSIWWQRNDLVKEGFYFKNLSRYYSMFPAENIKVVLHEDLKKRPEMVMKDICEFIGVEHYDDIDFSVKYNRSGIIRNKWYDRTLGHNSIIKETLKFFLPETIYSMAKGNVKLHSFINYLKDYNLEQPQFDLELKKKITEEIYGEDIRNLQMLLGVNLSHWLNFNTIDNIETPIANALP